MSKGTLTTLDFVIGVLREHEKELNDFSDKLEEMVKDVSGKNLKKDMEQIEFNLDELKQKIVIMDKKMPISNGSDMEVLLQQLLDQISIQNQNMNILIEETKSRVTSKEINELKESVCSLNASIKELMSKRDSQEK